MSQSAIADTPPFPLSSQGTQQSSISRNLSGSSQKVLTAVSAAAVTNSPRKAPAEEKKARGGGQRQGAKGFAAPVRGKSPHSSQFVPPPQAATQKTTTTAPRRTQFASQFKAKAKKPRIDESHRYRTSTPIRGRSRSPPGSTSSSSSLFAKELEDDFDPFAGLATSNTSLAEQAEKERAQAEKDKAITDKLVQGEEDTHPATCEAIDAMDTGESNEEENSARVREHNLEDEDDHNINDVSVMNETQRTWGGESAMTGVSTRTGRGRPAGSGGGGGGSAKALATARLFWTDQLKQHRDFVVHLHAGGVSSSSSAAHLTSSFSSISSTLCNNSSKPPELVEAIERAAVSTVRLYEFLANKAVEGIATSLSEFLHGVLRKFLANPSRMNISDRSWNVAKHVLNLCVTTPLSADILMSLKTTLLNIQMEFLRMWMTTEGVREMRFVDFACTEMDELQAAIQARLHQRVFSNAFGFSAL